MGYSEVGGGTLDSGQTFKYEIDYSGELPDRYSYAPPGSVAVIPGMPAGLGINKFRVIRDDGMAFCNTFARDSLHAQMNALAWFKENPDRIDGWAPTLNAVQMLDVTPPTIPLKPVKQPSGHIVHTPFGDTTVPD